MTMHWTSEFVRHFERLHGERERDGVARAQAARDNLRARNARPVRLSMLTFSPNTMKHGRSCECNGITDALNIFYIQKSATLTQE